MQKKAKKLFLILVITMATAVTVYATSKTIYTNTSYSVSKGGATIQGNLTAKYSYAIADITADGTTSGSTTTTVFKGYLTTSSSTTLKVTKSVSIIPKTCVIKNLGKIGSGTWIMNNNAFSGTTDYAGWNGTLKYISSSTSS